MGILFGVTFQRLHATNEKNVLLYRKTLELNELKTSFFTNVSHELRTPLTLILAPVKKLLHQNSLTPDVKHDLEIIERNASLLHHHVTDLLNVAQIDAGMMKLHYADCDLARMTRLIISNFESLARDNNIELITSLPDSLSVQTDMDKYSRIIINLISNAFKFTPAGGRIEITLGEAGNNVFFEISDNGPGIPVDMRDAVFERFRQVDMTISRQHEGTGLGLAIVKEFITLLNGTIELSAGASNGARFVVTLPRKAFFQAEPIQKYCPDPDFEDYSTSFTPSSFRKTTQPEDNKSAQRILVVEDNVDMNSFIVELLGREFRTVSAFNGKQGFESACKIKPDLILSDIMMPEMSGIEMTSLLRAEKDLARIPIILLTAKSDEHLRAMMVSNLVQGYLTKPFSESDLLSTVRRWLKEKAATDAILYDSNERFYGTLNEMIEGCQIIDREWRYIYINDAAVQYSRKNREELVGNKITDCYPGIEQTDVFLQMRRCMENNIPAQLTNELEYPDGGKKIYELKMQPVSDGILILSSDITSKNQAEEALKESELKLRTIFQSSRDAIGVSLDAIHVMVNPAYAEMFGFSSADEIVGTPIVDLIAPESRDFILNDIRSRNSHEHDPSFYTVKARKKDGTIFDMETSVSPYELHGNIFTLVMLRDITSRLETERSLQAALHDKEILIKEIYHRTRNSIQVISAMAALMQSYRRNEPAGEVLVGLSERIQVMSFVYDMLYRTQNLSTINFSVYLQNLLQFLRDNFAPEHPLVELTIIELADINVLIDLAQPSGLLINEIISNSYFHAFPADRGGTIFISVQNINPSTIQIVISDDGQGFPAGFDPLKDGKMGLQSVINIAQDQLQGKIEFSSGKGVTSIITFSNTLYSKRVG